MTTAYLSVRDACHYVSLSRRTIDYAKDRGELPFLRVGAKVLFRVADLDAWLNGKLIDFRAEAKAISKAVKP